MIGVPLYWAVIVQPAPQASIGSRTRDELTRAPLRRPFPIPCCLSTAAFAIKVPAEQGHIPDIEGLTGIARKEAMVKRAYGEDLFDR
jgi:hypothetical protein